MMRIPAQDLKKGCSPHVNADLLLLCLLLDDPRPSAHGYP